MREPRNPFRLRASEHIESDATFVRLFGPGMLELLKTDGVLDQARIIRSAPGGGKTTLMRLFTPGPLLTLHTYRLQDDCKELFKRMVEMGAATERGPTVLGVMLSCDRNYAALSETGLDLGRQMRVLFALLNARLVLTTLRSALALSRLNYPADLDRIELLHPGNGDGPSGLALPCRGAALHTWAQNLEDSICDALDSFGEFGDEPVVGSDTLTALTFLRPRFLLCDGSPVAERLLFMLDDVQKLARQQRQRLLDSVLTLRTNQGIWVAERLEALPCTDLLSAGAILGRDYRVTFIESTWRDLPKRFEQLVLNIAQRRAEQAVGVETQSFAACLESSLEGTERQHAHEEAVQVVKERVIKRASSSRYAVWIAEREKLRGSARQVALAWRALEILIEREERRSQGTFPFALTVDSLQTKDDSPLKTAAELFLAAEFKFPFYFGPATIAKLASSNIEQFLWVAGDEFEEIVSANLVNPKEVAALSPERQEAIAEQASRSLWDQIPGRVLEGRTVHRLLEAIANFSNWYTYRPTAPNDPGVNGIAITMRDREKLMDRAYIARYPEHGKLAKVLASALANNLLEAQLDYTVKGETWMVLNLNRLLCVSHRLPLNYGKFKEKTLAELSAWMAGGFKRPQKDPDLL